MNDTREARAAIRHLVAQEVAGLAKRLAAVERRKAPQIHVENFAALLGGELATQLRERIAPLERRLAELERRTATPESERQAALLDARGMPARRP